jgi:hypothetical protein
MQTINTALRQVQRGETVTAGKLSMIALRTQQPGRHTLAPASASRFLSVDDRLAQKISFSPASLRSDNIDTSKAVMPRLSTFYCYQRLSNALTADWFLHLLGRA